MSRPLRLAMKLGIIPVCLSGVAAGLFSLQGGFGRGHAPYDFPIALLALPWSLMPGLPRASGSDFVWFLVIPFLMNSLLVFALSHVICRLRK